MTFSSLAFLFVFFPVVFLLYWACNNKSFRNALLIIASQIFYAFGEPVAVIIMILSICLNYFFGLLCGEVIRGKNESTALKKTGLIAAVVLNIGLLFVYKYAHFFLVSFGVRDTLFDLALPIGISFFTFQGLSYVVDVYRDKENVQKNLFSVMLYISFFPQLIAGPIVKYHDIKDQLDKREFNLERIGKGLQRFIFGLAKKVLIAGPMGLMVDSIYALDVSSIGAASAWIAAISYIFQIYFDFSGYSDMAIGLGCIFGFDFKENFNKPYSAKTMQEFWRRWHISLSTWFKEYVYIPLGGNRVSPGRTYINKFIVFLLTGLWHGANWTFIVWGILHGIALIVEDSIKRAWKESRRTLKKWVSIVLSIFGHIYTLVFVTLTFVIFRADDLLTAIKMIGRMFKAGGSDAIALSHFDPTYLIALVLAVIMSTTLPDKLIPKCKTWMLRTFSVIVYVASLVMLVAGGYNPFIYFRF